MTGRTASTVTGLPVATVVTGLLLIAWLVPAPPQTRAQQRPFTAASPVQNQHPDRILVLKNGAVMRGRIRTVASGYLVASANGYVIMPFEKVHFDADSVEDAWLTMRLKRQDPTAASHLSLARWCMSQKLEKGAIRELREALELDPSNETARLMLQRVDDQRRQQSAAESPGAGRAFVSVEAPRQPDEARSLAGMSSETAREFVAHVQPLLLNRCGNARCHGAASTQQSFQLEHIRGSGNQRRRIERNLGAVVQRIDLIRPAQSELLQPGFGTHGGQVVFTGRAGAKQLETIREWIINAAAELRPAGLAATELKPKDRQKSDWGELAARRPTPAPPELPNSPTFNLTAEPDTPASPSAASQDGPLPDSLTQTSGAESTSSTQGELSNFQRLLRETAPANDVFSPDAFNRKYAR